MMKTPLGQENLIEIDNENPNRFNWKLGFRAFGVVVVLFDLPESNRTNLRANLHFVRRHRRNLRWVRAKHPYEKAINKAFRAY